MTKTGVIHGRFQVLHLKHMEYLLAAKTRCAKLYIGISNPDSSYVRDTVNDPERSLSQSNPLTYFERFEMIREAMLEFKVPREEFDIVPFPINRPEYLLEYVPKDAVFYMTIYDTWGEEKYKIFKALGLNVDVMWRKEAAEKELSAAWVRSCITAGYEWEHLVPKSVYKYIVEKGIDKRITSLAGKP
ncbi:MAG: nicotinate-nucleotide adenylyltransferase [Lachnospiraceae bacterium]|jgi:nicotinamide mononucleotide adenylyltransferase|nr:nicotinate-nucleotide adenylyltransferase [Lachnospiraceae bacterium]